MNRLERLMRVLRKRRRVVLGLTCEGSVQGIDAALVEIDGGGEDTEARLLGFRCYSLPEAVHRRLLRNLEPERARLEEVSRLDFFLGELFAEAAKRLLEEMSFSTTSIDLIGSAGKTIWHDTEPRVVEVEVGWAGELLMSRSTLAIGQSAVIAERTGAITVGDLRVRDVAAGGLGAPLRAYPDWVLLRSPERGRCVQHLGVVGSVTYLPPAASRRDVVAFDTGPGSRLVDDLVEIANDGRDGSSRDLELAAKGQVRKEILDSWMGQPFYTRPPPRIFEHGELGKERAREVVAAWPGVSAVDLVTTATAMVAESIAEGYRRFVFPRGPVDEVVVGGHGAHNPTLMAILRQRLGDLPVVPCDELGVDSEAQEAMGVAILANDALRGLENNLTGATGGRATVLGKVTL